MGYQVIRPDFAQTAMVLGPITPPNTQCGVLMHDWSEAIPARVTAISISYLYDNSLRRPRPSTATSHPLDRHS